MKTIERLPRTVHSTLRSSVFLFDLTRVVEELIFNSVDAGAAKVSVFLSVGAGYIKVEDNGSGITRDGLVLLGERHATSKLHHLGDMDSNSESLGFRGEALGSLSDISILEVVTKARGRPNAYRKVMKGWKCLFLGIDDNRQDVGTTVIVQDLFYNQPVRRRCMTSSPKKVLHSVKKCVIRTAYVYPQVSFRVIDIEREDVLLCTCPSSSPLPLVSKVFGNEMSSSLHEINYNNQELKLYGYLSGPSDTFSMKAFQYFYINSQYVSKGPVHKLINKLAGSYQCSSNSWRGEPEFQNGKRHKTQEYLAYILNLSCPLSIYDLIFEPSQTLVEFKDWRPVLFFVEQAVMNFWGKKSAEFVQGKSYDQKVGLPMEVEVRKRGDDASCFSQGRRGDDDTPSLSLGISNCEHARRHDIQSHKKDTVSRKSSSHQSLFTHSLNMPLEEFDVYHEPRSLPGVLHKNIVEDRLSRSEIGCDLQTDCCYQNMVTDSEYTYDSTSSQIGFLESNNHLWGPGYGFPPAKDQLLCDLTFRGNKKDDFLGSAVENSSSEGDVNLIGASTKNTMTFSLHKRNCKLPFLLGCSAGLNKAKMCPSVISAQADSAFPYQKGFGVDFNDYTTGRTCFSSHEMINVVESDCTEERSNLLADISCQEGSAAYLYNLKSECTTNPDLDLLSRGFVELNDDDRVHFIERNNVNARPYREFQESYSNHQFTDSEFCFELPYSSQDRLIEKVNVSAHNCAFEVNHNIGETLSSRGSSFAKPKGELLSYVPDTSSNLVFTPKSCRKTKLHRKLHFSPEGKVYYGPSSDENNFQDLTLYDRLNDETGWLESDSSITDNIENYDKSSLHVPVQDHCMIGETLWDELQKSQKYQLPRLRSRRSHSAPPFYRPKRKFSILYDHLSTTAGKDPKVLFFHYSHILSETAYSFKELSQSLGTSKPYVDPSVAKGTLSYSRNYLDEKQSSCEVNKRKSSKDIQKSQHSQICNAGDVKSSVTNELQYTISDFTKWRNDGSHTTGGDRSLDFSDHGDEILDISSGLLHLAGSSLVPESINRDSLEDAKVLLQLDLKFIPVVASGTLALIDQHAADERIRLEELRQKVLSGESKKIAYLDSEQELVLPEIGFQLLQNYADQIQKWGWICNIHSQCSESFSKNLKLFNRRPCTVTLIAVPCILGNNLTDKDLIEFLEQLAETDGSATMPPSVIRVLNSKACRGAIMFGDSLLPSECSLIFEELKRTSLCFQCAHGRPTTVPLLSLVELHKKLAKLDMQTGGPNEEWHGLRRHRPSVERAQLRLSSAKRFHNG